eukprot:TRINITY_DN503_c0_g2_i4.p3 TRINITY_DN503_c0_g2~~TRINITY_DN503_c0_g2_i4.p3  ORF type:complete len:112 (-),score=11.66 TRINITY_DN503_c0_g2_i4:273-608(-)
MKTSDIVAGAKYSNPTEKYGGVRVVDSIFRRRNGQVALSWTNAESRRKSSGHTHGVSTLATFARWARARELMSEQESQAHARRAAQHDKHMGQYGAAVHALLDRLDQHRSE